VNKTYIDLLSQILKVAGAAGTKGFEYLVKWEVAYGTVNLLTDLAWIVALLIGCILLWRWKISEDDENEDVKRPVRIAGIVVCVFIGLMILCFGVARNTQILMAPQGAAVCEMIPGCSPGDGN